MTVPPGVGPALAPSAQQQNEADAYSRREPNRGEQPTPESPLAAPDPPQQVQEALREMVRGYQLESDAVRRHHVRLWRQAEEFFKGNQSIWWSEQDRRWHTPFEEPETDPARRPGCDYSINFYRAWGMSIISALTTSAPKVQFLPQSAQSEQDVATAKAASKIVDFVARNNPMDRIRTDQAHALWTQGIWGAYVRFVVDGGIYGWREEAVTEDMEIDAEDVLMPDGSTARRSVTAPVQVGAKRQPNGAEKIDIYGPLYLQIPPQARDQRECYYLVLSEEQHKATLRAAYPQKAEKIGDPGGGAEETYERIVRLSLADAQGTWNSLPMSSLVTYKRAWLRPEAFWSHADPQMRQTLLDLYPDGVMVAFAGDVFVEARNERLDDHWRLCLGLPGIGIYRDGLGLDAIPIQRMINDAANILAEHRELASAPPILYDARYVNGDALAGRRMEPGSYMPVAIESAGPQLPLANLIFQPQLHVDPQLWEDGARLAETGEFITGALPAIFGGGSKSLKTATAYAQAREQAMGRLMVVWRAMREAHAGIMQLAVECFRRNRFEDVEMAVEGKGGEFQSDYIRLGELQGHFIARPSPDEGFPTGWAQVRDTIMQLLNSKDDEIAAVVGAPINRPVLQRYLGLPELVDPTAENRSKQFREIDLLAASAPVVTLQGVEPSVRPDLHVDDHATHVAVIKEWAVGDAGISLERNNPGGWANLMAHLVAHLDCEEKLAAQQGLRQAQVQQAVAAAAPAQAPAPAPQQPHGGMQ